MPQPVLIAGEFTASRGQSTFAAMEPKTREPLPDQFPISPWSEIDVALNAAQHAFQLVRSWPGERFALFLEAYASAMEAQAEQIIETAHRETALPITPRLKDGELPRTTNQLRQAAQAAREESWRLATIDIKQGLRSTHAALGPVVVFGPNNFPFAFNGISGGDFAAAVAAGNPVLGKAHTSHPHTSLLLAQAAQAAAVQTGMPPGFVQLVYRMSHADGERLASDPRVAAIGYTGARHTGLVLKQAADRVGKPIYLELSSINPVVVLPGALEERSSEIAEQFVGSCLMGTGQFCTNPGLVLLQAGPRTDAFVQDVGQRFGLAPAGTLLGEGVLTHLVAGVQTVVQAGAKLVAGGQQQPGGGIVFQNTLLCCSGADFLAQPAAFQTEMFGNASLCVIAESVAQMQRIVELLEGHLTGCVYSARNGADDAAYQQIEPALRLRVGRLLNDKMPTGVAVSAAMNHGGPFPATGHPGFTAVGVPASLRRFSALHCYDAVRPTRLPPILQDANLASRPWRWVDGAWTQADVG